MRGQILRLDCNFARLPWKPLSAGNQQRVSRAFEPEIVTPEKQVVRDRAEELQIPGKNGYLGILVSGHAPLMAELAIGEISYRDDGQPLEVVSNRCHSGAQHRLGLNSEL
jgi:ATP synthase, Delta/Epsilon chain, beta-sandwich domain